jgi:hypothetical protein
LQPGQPLSPAGQRPRQLVAARRVVLAVLGLVGDGCLLEQLGDLGLEVGVGAVGRRRGVGLDLGAVQGVLLPLKMRKATSSRRRRSIWREERVPVQ